MLNEMCLAFQLQAAHKRQPPISEYVSVNLKCILENNKLITSFIFLSLERSAFSSFW